MTEMFPDALMFLCQLDGRVVSADRQAVSLLNDNSSWKSERSAKPGAGEYTVAQVATKVSCSGLIPIFEDFAGNDLSVSQFSVNCGNQECRLLLRRLNGFQSQPLIAVELNRNGDANHEQTMLIEIGRAAGKLIHDFKNQMGGLKLYAAYLKKRFASQPELTEGLEIADKISQSVNEMTENAALIGKLIRPLELKLAETEFANLIEQVINQLQPLIAERNLKLENDLSGNNLSLQLDSQLMLTALSILTARSIKSSPEGGTLRFLLRAENNQMQFSIIDAGENLSDEELQSFFDFLSDHRLNKVSLNLALARRIIESHGGYVAAMAAKPAGTEIIIKFKI